MMRASSDVRPSDLRPGRQPYPASVEDRPDCWAIDGSYLGAPVPTWWNDVGPSPVVFFAPDHRDLIGGWVLSPYRPPRYKELIWGLAEQRSWWEWHWYRGIDPLAPGRAPVPKWMREAVLERDGLMCRLCGAPVDEDDVHLDHIHPVSLGGRNTVQNLQVTHSTCNMRKGNRI